MKYPKFFKSEHTSFAIMIVSETAVVRVSNYDREVSIVSDECMDSSQWLEWLPLEIEDQEFKEIYLQAQSALTLQFHDLFSSKESEFIKIESLKSEGY